MTKYGVKEYYLKSGLCWLATAVRSLSLIKQYLVFRMLIDVRFDVQDVVSTKRAIDNYCTTDPTFASTRECQFLNAIAESFDAGDAEGFTAAVAEYDRYALTSSCIYPGTRFGLIGWSKCVQVNEVGSMENWFITANQKTNRRRT